MKPRLLTHGIVGQTLTAKCYDRHVKELRSFVADSQNLHSEVDHTISEIPMLSDSLERIRSIAWDDGNVCK